MSIRMMPMEYVSLVAIPGWCVIWRENSGEAGRTDAGGSSTEPEIRA